MSKLKVLELFGGIGAPRKALQNLGIDFEVLDYVEFDKYAVKSYNALYNENFEPQDIRNFNKQVEADLLIHGSPCQSFSAANVKEDGGVKGSETKSSLLWETIRIVKELQVKPKIIIWENVSTITNKKNIGTYKAYQQELSELGYKHQFLEIKAIDVGFPQKRARVFTISHLIDIPIICINKKELKQSVYDLIKFEDCKEISVKMKAYITKKSEKWTGNHNGDIFNRTIASCINTGEGSRRTDASNYFIIGEEERDCLRTFEDIKEKKVVKLGAKNCFRLMGFSEEDINKVKSAGISDTQMIKQSGNSIVVPVLEEIFKKLLEVK